MLLQKLDKIHNGKYLKNYSLTYINKAGKEKHYEIVSRNELNSIENLGQKSSGVSIIAICQNQLLLLKEFRMGVNQEVYNLCAGMIEENETIEACIQRELFEETGLSLKRIIKLLPVSYAAVAISDISTQIAIVEVDGALGGNPSENEQITPGFFSKNEVDSLLKQSDIKFSSRAQLAAYFFSIGALEHI